MSLYRPEEMKMTKHAFEILNLPKGATVLEIGCGEGNAVNYLTEQGYQVTGIDTDIAMVNKAKKANPTAVIQLGDGEFLNEFTSYTFDCVMMEGSLSLINFSDEALHEAYCVMKKGGKLYVSDLMVKDPSESLIKELEEAVTTQVAKPHEENSCSDRCADEHKNRFLKFKSQGRFLVLQMMDELKEIGYANIKWEEVSKEPDEVAAKNSSDGHKTGYFMLTAEKPL